MRSLNLVISIRGRGAVPPFTPLLPAVVLNSAVFNGTNTIDISVSAQCTAYWMVTASATATSSDIINAVGAIDSGSILVDSTSVSGALNYSNVPAGDYYLHIVCNAPNTVSPSDVISTRYTFPANDSTAPILVTPVDAANGNNASTGSVSTDEGLGTLYWAVTTLGSTPTVAQVKAGQDSTGAAAAASGSQAVSSTGVQNISPSGLTASTAYTTHFMHEDPSGNQSVVASTSGFTTAAAGGNPELLVDPGFDDASKWSTPGGVTIAGSQAQWRTAAAFSTFWTGSSAANLAPVNENTDYTWSVTVENFTSGGNFQCQVTFYNSSFGVISTPSNNVNINGTGTFTTTLTAPAGAAYAAFRAKPFSANYNMDWSDASLKEV